MVKKTTRLLSFILAALMLVTMLPVISFAEEAKFFNGEALTTTKQTYEVNYDEFVGGENEEKTNIFVLDADWKFKPGEEPETVSFVFRGETITEKYNPNRHFSMLEKATKYITEKGIKNPVFILTEGQYSTRFRFSQGYTILGPKAGMNPNVPNADPTAEWAMSADRKIPTATEYFGEAVFRVEGGFGGDHLITGGNDNVGTQNFLVDGVVFQGDGSGVADESSSGGGTRNWYVQNCIFDDCHSNGGRGNWCGLAFDQRASQTTVKNLYLSNSYITNQNTVPLYSGHATGIYFNGVSAQNCIKGPFYNIGCIQWQGQTTSITNCHFWNPKGFSRTTGATEGIYINYNVANYCNSGLGTDDAPFRLNVKNNSFYHVNTKSAPLIQCSMAGNTKMVVEENIFISEEKQAARPAIELNYLTVNGVVTHNGIGNFSTYQVDGIESKVGNYKMTNEQALIQNNTFVGSEFQVLPDIFTNLHNETKIELLGNLYLDNMDSTEGKRIDPYVEDAQIYNKWVWLDAARTKASSEIVMEDISITSDYQPVEMDGNNITLNAGPKEYTKKIEVACNAAKNSVRVYESNASWAKNDQVAGAGTYTLNTAARTSYYIVSIVSIDGRTELDYKVTINRAPNPDAQLYDIIPEAGQEILSKESSGDTYNIKVGYAVKDFAFKLNTSANTAVFIQDSNNLIKPDANGVYVSKSPEVGEKKTYVIHIIDNNGEGLREFFYLELERAANTETELKAIASPEAQSIVKNDKTFVVTVPSAAEALNLSFTLSEGARMELVDPIYQMALTAKNGVYTISPIPGGENSYKATVYSQDNEHQEEWTVLVIREKLTGCELLGIADTQKVGNMFVAYTANSKFIISASVSKGASYQLFTDAACTEKLSSPSIDLKDVTTTVWLKVVAEDGIHASAPVMILINTYADLSKEEGPVVLPMNNNGIIGVTGGQFDGSNVIVVPLNPETKQYSFRVQGFGGYEARVFSDKGENPMRPANSFDLTIDAGRTLLYLIATKGKGEAKEVIEYTVIVLAPKTYKYTDTQTKWAAAYIEDVAQNGWGLLKGDAKGEFKGKSNLTRFEMAALMVRVAGANVHLYEAGRNPFTDEIAKWALSYVKAAYRMGMINGYEVKQEEDVFFEYRGAQNATRSEFFRVFANAILGYDVDEFYKNNQKAVDDAVKALALTDLEEIADWAKPAVYSAIYMKLVQGDKAKKVNPANDITRNEVAAVLSRHYAELDA